MGYKKWKKQDAKNVGVLKYTKRMMEVKPAGNVDSNGHDLRWGNVELLLCEVM